MLLLASKTYLKPQQCINILDMLSELEAINPALWENKIVWCDNFVKRVSHLYGKRNHGLPPPPDKKLVEKLINNGKKNEK